MEIVTLEARCAKTQSLKQAIGEDVPNDYTQERRNWVNQTSLEDVLAAMRQHQGDDTTDYDEGAHPTVGGVETELARMEEDTKKVRPVDALQTIKFCFHANAKTHC